MIFHRLGDVSSSPKKRHIDSRKKFSPKKLFVIKKPLETAAYLKLYVKYFILITQWDRLRFHRLDPFL